MTGLKLRRLALAPLIAAACAATPALADHELPRTLAGLSPADFAGRIAIADDPRAPVIAMSTQDGYTRIRSLKGALADDVHLRAMVDRRTGTAVWQVWHDLAYTWGQKDIQAVAYEVGGNAHETRPFQVTQGPDRCPPTDGVGHCGSATRVGFVLPEQTVREIASSYAPGSRAPWRIRFKSEDGGDVIGGLAPAEVAGLLQAVERLRFERFPGTEFPGAVLGDQKQVASRRAD